MKLKHRRKGYTIQIQTSKGKPLTTKNNMVLLMGRGYKGVDRISLDAISDKFMVVE